MKKLLVFAIILAVMVTMSVTGMPSFALEDSTDGPLTSNLSISLDQSVIPVGEETPVTITVMEGSIPAAGMAVSIFGPCQASGTTDASGRLTMTLRPDYPGSLDIQANGQSWWNRLFAVSSDYGVIEVSADDLAGNPLTHFYADCLSENFQWMGYADGATLMLLAKTGSNTVTISGSQNDGPAYCLTANLSVQPGIVTPLHVTSEDSIEVIMNFSFMGTPIAWVPVSRLSDLSSSHSSPIGSTNEQGQIIIRMTPGTANLQLEDYHETLLNYQLETGPLSLDKDQSITYAWDDTNAALAVIDLDGPVPQDAVLQIQSTRLMRFAQNMPTVVNVGTYPISSLVIERYAPVYEHYAYSLPDGQVSELMAIQPGTNEMAWDFTLQSFQLEVSPSEAQAGDVVSFNPKAVTNSGYLIRQCNASQPLGFTITRPDGSSENQYAWGFYPYAYQIPFGLTAGTCMIEAVADLGVWYGYASASASLNFASLAKPVIEVDKTMIPAGQESVVTITATLENEPLANVPVRLIGDGVWEGFTDSNGQWQVNLLPQSIQQYEIDVLDQAYMGRLFAVTPEYGVLEVTADDMTGSPLSYFNLYVSGNGAWTNTTVSRVLAQGGSQMLKLSREGNGTAAGYYIEAPVEVVPGTLNTVHLTSDGLVETSLNASYCGNPLPNMHVMLKPASEKWFSGVVGTTDMQGHLRFYHRPGLFDVSLNNMASDEPGKMLLSAGSQDLSSDGQLELPWDETNTGRVDFNLAFPGEIGGIWLDLDGHSLWMRAPVPFITHTGAHRLDSLYVITPPESESARYQYVPLSETGFAFEVTPQAIPLSFDLNLDSINMAISPEEALPGQTMFVTVEPMTKCGLKLNFASDGGSFMLDGISPKNGRLSLVSGDFHFNEFVLPETAEPGAWEAEGKVNLGSIYGEHNLPSGFTVLGSTGPKVLASTPAQDKTNVSTHTWITLTFGERIALHPGSLRNLNIVLTDGKGKEVPVLFVNLWNTLVVKPLKTLKKNTSYTLWVKASAISDTDGTPMDEDYRLTFKTGK